jgi:hypothetical protein
MPVNSNNSVNPAVTDTLTNGVAYGADRVLGQISEVGNASALVNAYERAQAAGEIARINANNPPPTGNNAYDIAKAVQKWAESMATATGAGADFLPFGGDALNATAGEFWRKLAEQMGRDIDAGFPDGPGGPGGPSSAGKDTIDGGAGNDIIDGGDDVADTLTECDTAKSSISILFWC